MHSRSLNTRDIVHSRSYFSLGGLHIACSAGCAGCASCLSVEIAMKCFKSWPVELDASAIDP